MDKQPAGIRKPMKRELCCIAVLICENYLEHVLGQVPYDRLFEGIEGNPELLVGDDMSGVLVPAGRDFLLSPDHWISAEVGTRVYENVVSILGRDDAVYEAGKHIAKTRLTSRFPLMRLLPVNMIISRIPKETTKFNTFQKVEIVENGVNHAIIRVHYLSTALTKLACDLTRGIYEGLGTLTGNPAAVQEVNCRFDGGDYCEYHVKWKAKSILARFEDWIKFLIAGDVINEFEQKIEEFNRIVVNQESVIKARTGELEKEKEKVLNVQKALSRHLPPQVVRKITEGEAERVWTHERKHLTVFFSDIKDSTVILDRLEPEVMADLLSEYLSEMNDLVQKHGGTLAQIVGDGLFVMFGAPDAGDETDNARRCVDMAMAMQSRIEELNEKWFERGVEQKLEVRCGINTGIATVGAFGARERLEYTAMGMNVHLASRLEKLCEPGGILISHSTWSQLKDYVKCQSCKEIELKGFGYKLRTYKVLFR